MGRPGHGGGPVLSTFGSHVAITGAGGEGRRLGRVPVKLRRQVGITGYKVRQETKLPL